MTLLSDEAVAGVSRFAEGIEFEETFADDEPVEPAHIAAVPHVSEGVPADVDAMYEEQLERRLREAEAMVKRTIERMRADEERRLAEWVRQRRDEEERRSQAWMDERRAAVERSLAQRSTLDDNLASRVESMLLVWQARFEQRLEQRRADEERLAERRRVSDDERLVAWRADLEQALAERFSERRPTAPIPDRDGEQPSSIRAAIAGAASARDVGRVLRDALAELATTAAFALSLHRTGRDDVAYRYRVATEDELGTLLRREGLDDGPRSAVAHLDGWVRAHRPVRIGPRDVTVHTAQRAVRVGEATIGVVTLQSETEPIADGVLAKITELVELAAPRLARLRDEGSFRGA